MNDNAALVAALVDVRRAHRLIWAYNRRIFELAKALEDHLSGFVFEQLLPWYNGYNDWRPNNSDVVYWNSVPYILTRLTWSTRSTDVIRKGDTIIGLTISADTAWETHDDDEDPANYAETVETSETEVIFYLGRAMQDMERAQMLRIWNNFDCDDPLTLTKSRGGKVVGLRSDSVNLADVEGKEWFCDAYDRFFQASASRLLR